MGLPPHTPLGDFIPKPHLRFAAVESSFYAPAVRQVSLRSLILSFNGFAFEVTGYVWGFDPGNSHSRASAPCDFRFPSR